METTKQRSTVTSTLIMAGVAILLAALAIVLAVSNGGTEDSNLANQLTSAIDEDAYHAVTLSTGTVYYGHLSTNGDALLLEDVYYLTGATEENPSGSLVKRGAEIYAPAGAMVLNADLVVQIDEIGTNSVIARGIERIAADAE